MEAHPSGTAPASCRPTVVFLTPAGPLRTTTSTAATAPFLLTGRPGPGWDSASVRMVDQELRLPGFVNSRDLGGWQRVGGSRTAFGRVVRSSTPATLGDGDRAAVRRAGLISVVDLRSTAEIRAVPHPLARHTGYRHRPLIDETTDSADDTARAASLGEVYRFSLTRNAAAIAAVMTAIAEAPPGPLLVCCSAGKDRTGMVAALLLQLAGVTREGIGQDYALSAPVAAAGQQSAARFDPASCDPEHIYQLTDHLDGQFGGPRAYLEQLGLTDREIDALADRLSVSPSPSYR